MKVDEKYPVHKHTETLTQGHTNVSILNTDEQQPKKMYLSLKRTFYNIQI